MTKRTCFWLALVLIALPGAARADDGWFLGAGSSVSSGSAPQSSVGLAFESRMLPALSLVVRGDYDFQSSTNVYRSAVFGMRLRAPFNAVRPWLEAGVGLGGNASTMDGGMASSVSIGASAATSFGFEPFAEARMLRIEHTPGASQLMEYRLGGQFKFRGEAE
ncbi:MAG: hypothetical protein ACRENS_13230 [Candidatus Eiseniibacteriota bacterium]